MKLLRVDCIKGSSQLTEDHLTVDELTLEKLTWYRWKLDLDKHTSNVSTPNVCLVAVKKVQWILTRFMTQVQLAIVYLNIFRERLRGF